MRFVLVHGSNQGGWCWHRLLPELARRGHEGVPLDLPGHGDDAADPSAATLEDAARRVAGAVRPGDAVLGHSLGGIAATLGADRAEGRARLLIYLAALVPVAGRATIDTPRGATDLLLAATRRGPLPGTTVFDPSLAPVLYDGAPAEDVALGLARMVPQGVALMKTVVDLRHPPPPRRYIRCTRDRIIDPDYQRRVTADWPDGTVIDLDAGHSPFFSEPASLAEALDRIAGDLA